MIRRANTEGSAKMIPDPLNPPHTRIGRFQFLKWSGFFGGWEVASGYEFHIKDTFNQEWRKQKTSANGMLSIPNVAQTIRSQVLGIMWN